MLDYLIDHIKRLGRVGYMMKDFYESLHKLFKEFYREPSERTVLAMRETMSRQTETIKMGIESQCISGLKLYDQKRPKSKR